MRRIRSATIVFLILLLLMSGCDSAGTAETTLPPETTVPAETTPPPETTVPPETTLPTETEPSAPTLEDHPYHDAFLRDGFIHIQGTPHLNGSGEADFYSVYYMYTGDSPVVELAALGITLNLPEEWLDRVYIIQHADPIGDSNHGYAWILNREILSIHNERAGVTDDILYSREDCMLHLYTIDITDLNREFMEHYRSEKNYLGETEDQVVFALIIEAYEEPGMHGKGWGQLWREALIEDIGQDAYDALVGDLIITRENVRDFVTIQNEVFPSE